MIPSSSVPANVEAIPATSAIPQSDASHMHFILAVALRHNEECIIGAGNEFGNGGDDFNWVENWNLVTDSMTYEVTIMEEGDIDGSRDVRPLSRISVF